MSEPFENARNMAELQREVRNRERRQQQADSLRGGQTQKSPEYVAQEVFVDMLRELVENGERLADQWIAEANRQDDMASSRAQGAYQSLAEIAKISVAAQLVEAVAGAVAGAVGSASRAARLLKMTHTVLDAVSTVETFHGLADATARRLVREKIQHLEANSQDALLHCYDPARMDTTFLNESTRVSQIISKELEATVPQNSTGINFRGLIDQHILGESPGNLTSDVRANQILVASNAEGVIAAARVKRGIGSTIKTKMPAFRRLLAREEAKLAEMAR